MHDVYFKTETRSGVSRFRKDVRKLGDRMRKVAPAKIFDGIFDRLERLISDRSPVWTKFGNCSKVSR